MNLKTIFILILVLTFPIIALPNDMSDSITVNANAIIKNYNVELLIKNKKHAILKKEIEIQILNKNGEKQGVFAEYYDTFRKIKSFKGKILNSDNDIIYNLKLKDLNDKSLINNFSLYEDNRIKYHIPNQNKFPYTVVYNYEIEFIGTFQFPTWQPIKSSYVALINASYKVKFPAKNPIRFKAFNIKNPEILDKSLNEEDEYISYLWKIEKIQAIKSEPFHLPFSRITPSIIIAPNKFEILGHEGSMASWVEFGNWRYDLIKNQGKLPEQAINDIKEIVAQYNNKKDIAKKTYEYMQSRTRYVSIQEGIGGWQPIDAKTTHNFGYGDCKALTNYTKSLLKVAGIESYYAVIKAGIDEQDIIVNFPSNQFNHAILCMPIEKDTIWLECTSQTAPFGYLGDFTGNKHALLIKENDSKIVSTTNYSKSDNFQNRMIKIKIDSIGNANTTVRTKYGGYQFENISRILHKDNNSQKEFFLKKLNINNFDIIDCKIGITEDSILTAYDSLKIKVKNYATKSNSRLFFELNVLNKNSYIPKKVNERISPININYAYTDTDSIVFEIPKGYIIEFLPENFELNSKFGEYKLNIIESNHTINVYRSISINYGVYDACMYNELIDFYEKIAQHDKSKCVLKKE